MAKILVPYFLYTVLAGLLYRTYGYIRLRDSEKGCLHWSLLLPLFSIIFTLWILLGVLKAVDAYVVPDNFGSSLLLSITVGLGVGLLWYLVGNLGVPAFRRDTNHTITDKDIDLSD